MSLRQGGKIIASNNQEIPNQTGSAGKVLITDGTNVSWGNVPTYTHEQGTSASTWSITHNLDKYPSVTVVDSAGTKVECVVTYIDSNECELKFNAAFKGKAYLN